MTVKRTKIAFTFSLYGNPEILEQIRATAKRDEISLSKRIIQIWEDYLAADKAVQENVC